MDTEPILKPGRNCWRICPAGRIAFLIEGASYFPALASALATVMLSRFLLRRTDRAPAGQDSRG